MLAPLILPLLLPVCPLIFPFDFSPGAKLGSLIVRCNIGAPNIPEAVIENVGVALRLVIEIIDIAEPGLGLGLGLGGTISSREVSSDAVA